MKSSELMRDTPTGGVGTYAWITLVFHQGGRKDMRDLYDLLRGQIRKPPSFGLMALGLGFRMIPVSVPSTLAPEYPVVTTS